MRPVALPPETHRVGPSCASFDDLIAVREYERDVRVHRAHVEQWEIRPLEDRVDTTYVVRGSVGAGRMVDIVDASCEHDTCTCPDFFGNELGTCKHIEAVRRALVGASLRGRSYRALDEEPSRPTVTVRADGPLGLVVCGRFTGVAKTWRDSLPTADGLLALRTVPERIAPSGVRVVHAAPIALQRLVASADLTRRAKNVARGARQTSARLDVLRAPLFPYQEAGVLHLLTRGRALLADDMGLGKTVQAIAASELLVARGEASRVVIVTPASLKAQWASEVERYTGQRAVVVGGSPAARQAALTSDARYKILNYELTWRELPRLQELAPDVLILDEAQRAKNFRTKTATTLRSLPSRFLFVLTGTPVENRLDDLFSLLQLVDPGVLGPLWRFNLEFHRQNERGRVTGYKNLSALRQRISPVVLRRRKEDVLTQLPPLTTQTRFLPLAPAQVELEEEYRASAAPLLAVSERRALTKQEQDRLMALLTKARQACDAAELCAPELRKRASPKLDELETIVEEISGQGTAKILVFSEWVEMLKLAAERLEKLGVGFRILHGGVPTEKRAALLEGFRTDEDARVLLSSDAGGVGLNLQVASYVVHLDLPWNPGKLDQRTARAHRLGQTRGVNVIYLCSETGIERGIEATLAKKRDIREAALDGASTTEELEAPSFSVFLRQLREVLATPQPVDAVRAEVADTESADTVETIVPETTEASPPPPALPPSENAQARRARERLRLADVVLAAGFGGDAVRAAYDALASTFRARLDQDAPEGHGALTAAVFRDLVPSGRLPLAAHGVLARIHDLASLEQHGVSVDGALASEAVAEAKQWVERLLAEPAAS